MLLPPILKLQTKCSVRRVFWYAIPHPPFFPPDVKLYHAISITMLLFAYPIFWFMLASMCHVVQVHWLAAQDAKHIYRTRVIRVVSCAQPRHVFQRTRNNAVRDMENKEKQYTAASLLFQNNIRIHKHSSNDTIILLDRNMSVYCCIGTVKRLFLYILFNGLSEIIYMYVVVTTLRLALRMLHCCSDVHHAFLFSFSTFSIWL